MFSFFLSLPCYLPRAWRCLPPHETWLPQSLTVPSGVHLKWQEPKMTNIISTKSNIKVKLSLIIFMSYWYKHGHTAHYQGLLHDPHWTCLQCPSACLGDWELQVKNKKTNSNRVQHWQSGVRENNWLWRRENNWFLLIHPSIRYSL